MSSNRERRRSWFVLGGLALLGAVVVRAASGAERIDPTVPQSWMVGAPHGASPTARIDAQRSGRAGAQLPMAPRVIWRARVQGGIAHPVTVDAHGSVIVSSQIAALSQLGPNGKTTWTARTGASPAASAPALTSDGTRVLLTSGGELFGFDAGGRQRFGVKLPLVATQRVPDLLPLDDGGVLVAAGRTALRLDRTGSRVAGTRLDGDVVLLIGRGSEVLLITERGDVHSWKPPAEPSKLGSVGGRVDGGALAGNTLTAVVDQKKLVDLDLGAGTRVERAEVPSGLSGAPALFANGGSRIVTLDGLLLGHDRQGTETARVALEPPSLLGDAGAGIVGSLRAAPPVIVDAQGRVGFVRPGLDAGVVDKSGNIHAAPGAACLDPIGVAPAGARRMVLACRSGVVFLIGDK